MGEDNREWSWVGEDGTQHAVDESGLSFALSSEEIPAYALVSKKGWGEWLPAMQVAELLWALPAGCSDSPRKPIEGARGAPPLALYPALKKRALAIASGAIDPASESSLNLPSVAAKSRPTLASSPALNVGRPHHEPFSASDIDEPTLQIDADALDHAFERLQTDAKQPLGPLPSLTAERSSGSALSGDVPPSARGTNETASPPSTPGRIPRPEVPRRSIPRPDATSASGAGRGKRPSRGPPANIIKRLGTTSRPPAPSAPDSERQIASSPAPQGPPPIPRPPAPSSPDRSRGDQSTDTGRPPSPSSPDADVLGPSPFAGVAALEATPAPAPRRLEGAAPSPRSSAPSFQSSPSLTELPLDAPLLEPSTTPSKSRRWPWVALLLGFASAAAYMLGRQPVPKPATPVAPAATAPKNPEPPKPGCQVTATPVAVAGWAHAGVKPVLAKAPGVNRVAVGYAQTSKIAVGLILDVTTLNAEKPFSNYQNSPLLSVVPATTAMGQQISFYESRAASTLQSAVFVPASTPYAVGLSNGAVAVRRLDEADVVIWKPQWETINVPSTVRLDATTHGVALRAGGERGSILLGKLSETGEALGELQEVAPGTTRLGEPSILAAAGKVVVAFDGAPRGEQSEHIYLAVADAPKLPTNAQSVLTFEDDVSAVSGAAVQDGAFLVQYTRGAVGEQRVFGQVLDKELHPVDEPMEISPPGKDAYNGELFYDGEHVVAVYLVRNGLNHEFWATGLRCSSELEGSEK